MPTVECSTRSHAVRSRPAGARRGSAMLRRTLAAAVCALMAPRIACGLETIYLANDDHTDYFWSGDGTQYRTAFLEMLDYYMDQAEATAANPPDQRGRFNTDGSLWIWEYEKNRSEAEFDRLVSHLGAGTITMPKNTAIILYGAMPTEAVLRDMYYAGRLERAHGLSFPTVYPMENQVLQGGLASLWAGSGVLYSWKGICDCATLINAADRPREIYRFEGPDGQGITLKWNSALNGNQSIGGYAEARDPFGIVNYCETNAAYNARWVWPRHGAFGYGWDDLSSTTNLFIQAAQQLSNPNRRVVVSNQVDFFEDFLSHHGAEIPTFGGSFGNEWELLCAAMADVTAGVKRRVETLRTAESLKTLVDLHDPNLLAGREAERDLAFLAMGLFYEHCWGGDGVVPQNVRIQFQRDQLARIALYVDDLLQDALVALGGLVAQPGGTERHVVWNPLSFPRTEAVDLAVATPGTVHVVEVTSGLEVPSQAVTVNGQPRLRILASNVPSVGYRVYEVRPGAGQSFPPSATVTLPSFDNGIYRVTLGARGQITSVLDHQDGDRELVEAGGAIHDLGNGSGSVVVENAGPVSTTLLVNAGGSPPHQTRVTLTAGLDQIAIEGRITANFNTNVGYLSRFNLAGMTMRHEEVGMIAQVARAAAGGDYADQNARTDFLTMNHFVDLSTASRGVTLSNWDGAFFQAGNSTVSTLDATTPSVRAMAGFRVGGYGIPNQGATARF
ncbi:MAG: glycoside hydrolase [Candidatus Eisenbacteria bacterium]|nr:glycoside hydrolase [Candidatus Eisenbacteria bacterium]